MSVAPTTLDIARTVKMAEEISLPSAQGLPCKLPCLFLRDPWDKMIIEGEKVLELRKWARQSSGWHSELPREATPPWTPFYQGDPLLGNFSGCAQKSTG